MDNGIDLAFQSFGEHGPALIILHGLFGSGRNWHSIGRRLADDFRVLLPDLRNHGGSPHARPISYPALAADVRALLDRQAIERCSVIGHSVGGKVAMWLALAEPARIERLIVVDIAPVRYRNALFELVRTLRGLPLNELSSRADADRWLAQHIAEPRLRGFLLQNLVRSGEGYAWRIDLDAIDEALPQLMDFPETDNVEPFSGPALFVAGGRSDYLLPEHHGVIRALFPQALFERVEDAGHWVHAEQPERFLAIVQRFLR